MVATVVVLLVLSPGTAGGAPDRDGRFAFAPVPEAPAKPPLAPGKPRELRVVHASSPVATGLRVVVLVEGGLPVEAKRFAREVARVLGDSRGWKSAGYAFRLVGAAPADIQVVLASPGLTDSLCAPLQTLGTYSCAQGSRAVLNFERWQHGAAAYDSLRRYRTYMINHEVGHLLGRGHVFCPAAGSRAPLMMQQTKGVAPCLPNPWPLQGE
jgi:Protein of unknown function (DUF3152)